MPQKPAYHQEYIAPAALEHAARGGAGPGPGIGIDALGGERDAGIGAAAEAAAEALQAEDGEGRLDGEHHAEDVGHRRHHLEEQLDDEPHARVAREQPQRAQHAQDAQRLERPERGEHLGEQAEPRDADDEEVEHLHGARRAAAGRRQKRARSGAVPLSSPAAARALLSGTDCGP